MKERWKLCLLHKGRRLDKELLRKIKSTHKDTNWKIKKLKPKEYKNIPNSEKYEIKFSYDYQKAKREALEEKAKKIEKMTALQYLETLNDDIKEKLIGLCLDINIIESLFNDSTENYDNDEEVEEEDEEDEEQIE